MSIKKSVPPVRNTYTVSGCNITAECGSVNADLARAVEALAAAALHNADAIAQIAKSLTVAPGRIETGIRVGINS